MFRCDVVVSICLSRPWFLLSTVGLTGPVDASCPFLFVFHQATKEGEANDGAWEHGNMGTWKHGSNETHVRAAATDWTIMPTGTSTRNHRNHQTR